MPRTLQAVRHLGVGLLLALGVLGAADAQIIVTPTVTLVAGLYHYNYSITNNTASDLFQLDIAVAPDALAGTQVIRNLSAPTGFVAANDSVLGIVSFLEDTGTFSSTPQNGFIFDSPLAPAGSTFTGNLAPSSTSGGPITTQSGNTRAPVTPEPGSLAAFGALTASGMFAARRKSRRK
jgi:hypothetical protein